jgi:hypothetical protein
MRSSDGPVRRRRNYTISCSRRSIPMSDSIALKPTRRVRSVGIRSASRNPRTARAGVPPRGPPKPPSVTPWRLDNADYRTCSTVRLPAGGGRSSSDSGRVSSSQAGHSDRLRTTICRSWDGRDIGPGPGRQERKSVPCAVGHRAPEARKAEPVLARLGEFPLRFGRFRAGELEEMRRWDGRERKKDCRIRTRRSPSCSNRPAI